LNTCLIRRGVSRSRLFSDGRAVSQRRNQPSQGRRRRTVLALTPVALRAPSVRAKTGRIRQIPGGARSKHQKGPNQVDKRILPSSHTNPIYALVQGAPLRASRKSAEWCRKAVDVCWASKSPRIRKREIEKAAVAWDHARVTYDRIISECVG
jgi:hypothetical protein